MKINASTSTGGGIRRAKSMVLPGMISRAAVVVILAVTLFPYDFVKPSYENMGPPYYSPGGMVRELLANVALFVPLGFGLAAIAEQRRMERRRALLSVFALSLALSLAIELLQLMIPTRYATMTDLVSNSLGGTLGALCHWRYGCAVYRWVPPVARSARTLVKRRWIGAGLAGYVGVTLLLPLPVLYWSTGLSNWDGSFPLVVGNEATGDRPWYGRIERLEILGRAISDEEAGIAAANGSLASVGRLLAGYDFRGQPPFEDWNGHLPQLVRTVQTANESRQRGVTAGENPSLQSVEPATDLVRRLRGARQFTVSVICGPASIHQRGPARIVTISRNPHERNFTIGQDMASVVVRLRTPFTGDNGTPPELRSRAILQPNILNQLIASYNGSVLRLFVDGRAAAASLQLNPEPRALLVGILRSSGRDMTWARVYADRQNVSQDLAVYYLAAFVPLGCLFALVSGRQGRTGWMVGLLLATVVLLIAGLTECLISILRGSPFRVANVLLGLFLGASPVFCAAWRDESANHLRIESGPC